MFVFFAPLFSSLLSGHAFKLKQSQDSLSYLNWISLTNKESFKTYILIQTANHLLKEGHVREDDRMGRKRRPHS